MFQDLSGRPHLSYDLSIPTERVGTYDTQVMTFTFLLILYSHLPQFSQLFSVSDLLKL